LSRKKSIIRKFQDVVKEAMARMRKKDIVDGEVVPPEADTASPEIVPEVKVSRPNSKTQVSRPNSKIQIRSAQKRPFRSAGRKMRKQIAVVKNMKELARMKRNLFLDLMLTQKAALRLGYYIGFTPFRIDKTQEGFKLRTNKFQFVRNFLFRFACLYFEIFFCNLSSALA
jgi:hypothetical protein